MQTSDSHGILWNREKDAPSWLKMATLIRQEIEFCGNGNYLLIDCGDTVQGTLIGALTDGVATIQPIIKLPFDVWVPGNHELDFGTEAFRTLCKLTQDKVICCNLNVDGQEPLPGWRIFIRNGVKIAVIGLAPSYYENWFMPDVMAKCHNDKGVAAIGRIMPSVLAEKPDVIVLASHHGWTDYYDARSVNELNAIANKFPEIDLMFGAHSHRIFPGRKVGLNSWYLQAGAHTEYLGIVKITVDTEKHEVVDISSCLKSVIPSLEEDEQLRKELAVFRAREDFEFERPVDVQIQVPVSSKGKPGLGCQTSDLICQAIASAVGADVALHGKLSEISFFPGRILGRHLFWMLPYENRIVTIKVTSDELEEIFAEQWENRESYRYCGPWNAEFKLVGNMPKIIRIAGETPVKGKRYLLAMNNHTAAGSGVSPVLRKYIFAKECECTHHNVFCRQAVEDYIVKCNGLFTFKSSWISK